MSNSLTFLAAGVVALTMTATPIVAEKWDMPMAYSGSNFHSVTGAEFAKCVTTGTGGEIEIVTHPSGSLFPRSPDQACDPDRSGPDRRAPALWPPERERAVRRRLRAVSRNQFR